MNSVIADNALLYWVFEMLTWVLVPALALPLVTRTPGVRLSDLGYHLAIRGLRNL